MQCTGSVSAPEYASSPTSGSTIDVGTIMVGSSGNSALSVSETGNATLNVTSHSLSGANAADFSVTPATLSISDGGAAQELTIICTPSSAETRTAMLTVNHNAGGSPATYTLQCTGSGSAPVAEYNRSVFGNALHFDGANDVVDVGDLDILDGVSQYSIEAWVKFDTFSSWDTVFGKRTGDSDRAVVLQSYDSLGTIGVSAAGGYGKSTTGLLSPNTWYHIAIVYDGTQTGNADRLKLYVDGALQTLTFSGSVPATTPVDSSSRLVLGAEYNGTSAVSGSSRVAVPFNGILDDVRLWTVARTAAEISASTSVQLSGTESNLAIYYNFNQGIVSGNNDAVTTLNNNAGTTENGTLWNFALSGTTSNWVGPAVPGYASSPASGSTIDVGTVAVGASGNITLTVSENGSDALNVTGHSLSGANAADFSVTPATLSISDGGAAQDLTITCTPSSAETRTAMLTVNHNADDSPATYTLQCTGELVADFIIMESGDTEVNESGTTDTFTVVLDGVQPASNVVINVTSGNTNEAMVNPATLTFTGDNWDTAQTVTVVGVYDTSIDGDQTTIVTLSVDKVNSDDAYDALDDKTISVTTVDNNTAEPPFFTCGGPKKEIYAQDQYDYSFCVVDPGGDYDNLTITALSSPDWLTLTLTEYSDDLFGELSGTPALADIGAHSIVLQATNSDGLQATKEYTLIVVENDIGGPVFTSVPPTTVKQDQPYVYNIIASGTNALEMTADKKPGWLTFIDNGDGSATLSGTPEYDDSSRSYEIMIKVKDTVLYDQLYNSYDAMNYQTFNVIVEDVNDPPKFWDNNPATWAFEGSSYSSKVYADDRRDFYDYYKNDNNELTFRLNQKPDWLILSYEQFRPGESAAILSGTPAYDDAGIYPIEVVVSDPDGAEASYTFKINVYNVNSPPKFTSTPPVQATQDVTYTYVISATDPDLGIDDDEKLRVSSGSLPSWLSLYDQGEGQAFLEGIPTNYEVGVYTITLYVFDAAWGSESDKQTFEIVVADTNEAPKFTTTPGEYYKGDYFSLISLLDTDPDDEISLTAVKIPDWLYLESSSSKSYDGKIEYHTHLYDINDAPVPPAGEYPVILQAQDLAGAIVTQAFTITAYNNRPVAFSDKGTYTKMNVPVAVNVLANDEDIDGDVLSIKAFGQPSNGTVTISGTNQLLYTPPADFWGVNNRFTYTMTDGYEEDSAEVWVHVLFGNSPPVAVDDTIETFTNQPVTFLPLQNDSDPDDDSLNFRYSDPAHGELIRIGQGYVPEMKKWFDKYQYVPDENFVGIDTFEYTIEDSELSYERHIIFGESQIPTRFRLVSTATVTVEVRDIEQYSADLKLSRLSDPIPEIVNGEKYPQSYLTHFQITNLSNDPAVGVVFKHEFDEKTFDLRLPEPSQGRCKEGITNLVCELGIIPAGQSATVEFYLGAWSKIVVESGVDYNDIIIEDTAIVTSVTNDPNQDNNQDAQQTKIIFPDTEFIEFNDTTEGRKVRINADKFEKLDNGHVRASGNIDFTWMLKLTGADAWLEIEMEGLEGKRIVDGRGTVETSNGIPIYTEDKLLYDGNVEGIIQPNQVKEILLSEFNSFPITEPKITSIDLKWGTVKGEGQINIPQKGDVTANLSDVKFEIGHAGDLLEANFDLLYGDGSILKIENASIISAIKYQSGENYLWCEGTLKINLPGNDIEIEGFRFDLKPDGTIDNLDRWKQSPSVLTGIDTGGTPRLYFDKAIIDNYGLYSDNPHFLYKGKKIPLENAKITKNGLQNVVGEKIKIGDTNYIVEESSSGYNLKTLVVDYKVSLPQNHFTVKNFDPDSSGNNADIILEVANTEMILKKPYLKDGVLYARGVEWEFPEELGPDIGCNTLEEIRIHKELYPPCKIEKVQLADFYWMALGDEDDDKDTGITIIHAGKDFYTLELQGTFGRVGCL
ncbi:Ig-like domain-containing protein [Anaerolineales bacterium HSG25]|nr:Ig-like domain-containing protein [Anaerolineales bacterium HSG25]